MQAVGFIGCPGSGKSTQAELLFKYMKSAKKKVEYINLGQVLRESGDKSIIDVMNTGELIDDEIVFAIIKAKLKEIECDWLILDGFFRRANETNWLIDNKSNLKIDSIRVVDIELTKKEAILRLSQRGRADDTKKDITVRLRVFRRERRGVVKVLKKRGVDFIKISGIGSREEVFERVIKALS